MMEKSKLHFSGIRNLISHVNTGNMLKKKGYRQSYKSVAFCMNLFTIEH